LLVVWVHLKEWEECRRRYQVAVAPVRVMFERRVVVRDGNSVGVLF